MSGAALLERAASIAARAVRSGADAAEAYMSRSAEREVKVRGGRLERTVESANLGCGLRVEREGRHGFSSTTDLSGEGVLRLVETALAIAERSPEDADAAIPGGADLPTSALDLDDPALAEVDFSRAVEIACRAEEAALRTDPRVTSGEGTTFGSGKGEIAIAGTRGIASAHAGTRCALACYPVAVAGEERQRQYWFESRRFLADLPPPEEVGARAGERAVRMLEARPVASGRFPVVLDPLEGARFWGSLVPALLGDAVRRGVSFLSRDLGKVIGSEAVTLVEDPVVPRAPGSRPFDGEGWPTSRRILIDRGRLTAFLYDTASARRAGTSTTGSAVRHYANPPSPGAHAPRLEAGPHAPKEILAAARRGLYVTQLIGFGMNLVTGEYSRGANGWWFEGGEFAFPVHEVTLSGNLREMLKGVAMVGSDLVARSAVSSPTFMMENLVISGGGTSRGGARP